MMPEVESASWLGAAKAKSPKISELDSAIFVGKAEAARMLKVHPRQLERRAQQGAIAKHFLPRKAGEKSARVVYSRADIEALLDRVADVNELDTSELAITWVSQAEAARTLGISPQQVAKKHRDGYIERRASPNGVAEYSMADILALKSGKPIRVAPPVILKPPAWDGPLDPKEWLSKAHAAKFLGVSLRQIERREAQGAIEKRTLPRLATESTGRVLYSRADLVALKNGTPNTHARAVDPEPEESDTSQAVSERLNPSQNGNPTALAVVQSSASRIRELEGWAAKNESLMVVQDRLIEVLSKTPTLPAPAAPAPKPWLTLEEAVEYSGLPRGYLLKRAREGWDAAVDVSTGGAHQFWRFNRAALGAGK